MDLYSLEPAMASAGEAVEGIDERAGRRKAMQAHIAEWRRRARLAAAAPVVVLAVTVVMLA